jgi:DNA gyrase/topoisomerase IV subunit B
LIVASKKGKIVDWFFDLKEYNAFVEKNGDNYEFSYKKGLGSWKASELKDIISRSSLDNFLETLEFDETTDDVVNSWLGDGNADKRKVYILENEFEINKI